MPPVRPAPWNKDRCVGPRTAFTPSQVHQLRKHLKAQDSAHDLCLFTLAVDSMLRCSDLLQLRVGDVLHASGEVRSTFPWKQKKTVAGVYPVLTKSTRQACRTWVEVSGKKPADFLFTRRKASDSRPIHATTYRDLIKQWADAIGLDPHDYSTHSLRRTKPVFLYKSGVSIEDISLLLGHKDTKTTLRYLGLTLEQAQDQALRHDIFSPGAKNAAKQTFPTFSDEFFDRLAAKVADELSRCFPALERLKPPSDD